MQKLFRILLQLFLGATPRAPSHASPMCLALTSTIPSLGALLPCIVLTVLLIVRIVNGELYFTVWEFWEFLLVHLQCTVDVNTTGTYALRYMATHYRRYHTPLREREGALYPFLKCLVLPHFWTPTVICTVVTIKFLYISHKVRCLRSQQFGNIIIKGSYFY